MEKITFHQFDLGCEKFHNDKRKLIVIADIGKSQYKVFNIKEKRVAELKVDGCLIKNGERCDYLLLVSHDSQFKNKDAYFIELKGSSVIKAASQIDTSIEILKHKLTDFEKIFGRIVVTKISVPNIQNHYAIVNLRKKLRSLNGDLIYRVKLEEQI